MSENSAIQAAALHAEAFLDESLPASRLAATVGLSADHFRRVFKQVTGETPAGYVERLRTEKAAFRLLIERETVLRIALDCGYANHETFTRAFRRRFGLSPSDFRHRHLLPETPIRQWQGEVASEAPFNLSKPRIARLQPIELGCIRVTGPYENVPADLWARLKDWASRANGAGRGALIGIGHDSPVVTSPNNLRFDACISTAGGARPEGRVFINNLPEVACVVTTHVGPYATLPKAYPEIFGGAAQMPGTTLIGLPAIEVYRDPSVDILRDISVTDVYLPVRTTN